MAGAATVTREPEPLQGDGDQSPDREQDPLRSTADASRRRFTVAVVVGSAVVLPVLLWVLWDLWSGSVNPLRAVPYDNFYDLQARAMFHGHLYLPDGRMGFEAFVRNGRPYTYFGIFASLMRMPILLVTSSLDGKLTAPSLLLAWLTTALFSSLALWRLRILMRGRAVLGRAEAASFGALMATIMGGSVILYLSATPFIYNEDFAWSVPLTIGSLFALLGVMERPSWGRVIASGVLVLATNLNRTPTGYACVIAALLIAGWFALGRGGSANRRWALPLAAVGLVPFAVNCAVTYAKFGIPVGLPMADQIWATVNAHRRQFLAANGGKAFSFAFLPSTAWAYLQPFGVRLSGLFPFITPPAAPAAWLGGAVLDQSYPTASIPATMPLLFVLSCWGVVTTFRPRGPGQVHLARIILLGAGAGTAGVLLWGYISERYMADFVPFLVLAAGIGLIDIWRRMAGRTRRRRQYTFGILAVVAAYCVAANVAIAAFPVAQWTQTQDAGFVSAQQSLSISSLADSVWRGSTLPYWGPAGQLFAAGNCSGLYLSSGNDMRDVPGQQIEHYTWAPVEQDPAFTRTIGFTFNRPEVDLTGEVPLMRYGASTLVLQPDGPGWLRVVLENSGTTINWPLAAGWKIPIQYLDTQYKVVVTTDPNLNLMTVKLYGATMINHFVAGRGPAVVATTPPTPPGSPDPVVTVATVPSGATSADPMSLCHSLLHGR